MKDLIFVESVRKMPLMILPVRSTVVTLPSATVLLSPGSGLSSVQISGLSGVTEIVAPSLFHCAGIPKAIAAFSKARVWGPPGAPAAKPEIQWTHELSEAAWPYQAELPAIAVKGMPKVNEFVFFHRETRSLIVADLCFNMARTEGLGAWLILHLFGTYRRLGISRFYTMLVKDSAAFEASLKQILNLDFERIVVGHGDLVLANGRELLRRAAAARGFTVRRTQSPVG